MATSMCRLCMGKSNLTNTIYDDDMAYQINVITGLQLVQYDKANLPVSLCIICVQKIYEFHQFRTHCWEVQEELEQLFRKDAIEEATDAVQGEVAEMEIELLNVGEVSYEIEVINEYDECELISESNLDVLAINADASDSTTEILGTNPGNKATKEDQRKRKTRDEKEIYRSLLMACETCGKMIERNRMEGHRNRHEGIRPYPCTSPDCDSIFYCQVSRRLHCRNKHSAQSYQCVQCDKHCRSKKALYIHNREVHRARNFECLVCGMAFVSNGRRKRHMDVHSNIKKYCCEYCPKSFHRNNNLQVHLRTHTKEKPYACQQCPKTFGYINLLKSHIARTHDCEKEKKHLPKKLKSL